MGLSINELSKTYPNGVRALNKINLEIGKGMFGLLGPNGAGKSSLMRTIATLQDADEGSIYFNNIDVFKEPQKVRKQLGYLPQDFGVYPTVSCIDMLNHIAILKGITDKKERKQVVEYLLQKVNLWDVRKQRLGGYSGGMKQRFGVAQALLADPKLIIVDEPTAGLDPAERKRFLNILSNIGEDVVIIFSTHIVEDIQELCIDMAIINKGEVILKENPIKAINKLEGKIWKKRIEQDQIKEYNDKYQVISEHAFAGKPEIKIFADSNPENDFKLTEPDLEDVYFFQIENINN